MRQQASSGERRRPRRSALPPRPPSNAPIIAAIVVAGLALVALLFFVAATMRGDSITGAMQRRSEAAQHEERVRDACARARAEVRLRLVAPGTARFCSDDEAVVRVDGSVVVVGGWVDSQNPMGAMLRAVYEVHVDYAGGEGVVTSVAVEPWAR